jgi:hypothetical protein
VRTLRCAHAVLPTQALRKKQREMLESTLHGFALLALASIAINTVKWLLRHPTTLLLAGVMLSATAYLMR